MRTVAPRPRLACCMSLRRALNHLVALCDERSGASLAGNALQSPRYDVRGRLGLPAR